MLHLLILELLHLNSWSLFLDSHFSFRDFPKDWYTFFIANTNFGSSYSGLCQSIFLEFLPHVILWSSPSLVTPKSFSSFNFDLSLELQPCITNFPPWYLLKNVPPALQDKHIPRKQPPFPLSKQVHLSQISNWWFLSWFRFTLIWAFSFFTPLFISASSNSMLLSKSYFSFLSHLQVPGWSLHYLPTPILWSLWQTAFSRDDPNNNPTIWAAFVIHL